MQPGLTSDLSNFDNVRKTAVINKELIRLKVDIAALHEMRLAKEALWKNNITPSFGKENQSRKQESMVWDLLSEITSYRW